MRHLLVATRHTTITLGPQLYGSLNGLRERSDIKHLLAAAEKHEMLGTLTEYSDGQHAGAVKADVQCVQEPDVGGDAGALGKRQRLLQLLEVVRGLVLGRPVLADRLEMTVIRCLRQLQLVQWWTYRSALSWLVLM